MDCNFGSLFVFNKDKSLFEVNEAVHKIKKRNSQKCHRQMSPTNQNSEQSFSCVCYHFLFYNISLLLNVRNPVPKIKKSNVKGSSLKTQ